VLLWPGAEMRLHVNIQENEDPAQCDAMTQQKEVESQWHKNRNKATAQINLA
jgi:hypothetical protein